MGSRAQPSVIPLVFYYHRLNRYSFNALAGALDMHPRLSRWPISLPRTPDELRRDLDILSATSDRTVVGMSAMTSQFRDMRMLLRNMRSKHGKRLLIVIGGPHVTADPASGLQSGADYVVLGEGEEVFPLLLECLGKGESPRDIPGIVSSEAEEARARPRAQPVDIEAYPSISPRRRMVGPIEITRGCAFACSYCQTSNIFGTRLRHRSVANILKQAASLRTRNCKVVRLLSPNAFSYGSPDGKQLNFAALTELLAALRQTLEPGARIIFGYFPSEARPEHVTPETLDLIRRYANNDEIVIGAQSGSQRVLNACHRSHDVDTVLSAVALARRSGFKVIVDFIFGLPGETPGDVRETISVMKKLARLGARIHPHVFSPLPGTVFAEDLPGRISADILRALAQLQSQKAVYGGPVEQLIHHCSP